MDIYKQKSRWKWYLVIAGLFIVAISLVYTKYITDQMAEEERKKADQLKTAAESLSYSQSDTLQCDVTFQLQFLESNTSIPVIWVNEFGQVEDALNYGPENDTNTVFLQKKLDYFNKKGIEPSVVSSPYGDLFLYYENSKILTLLQYYPFIQFILITAFIAFGYMAFSNSRRAEQNRVWAGMAKETAHQLGTPISGMVAWIEHLKLMKEGDEEVMEILDELDKDIDRLNLVADRFSKIGSAPELTSTNIYQELEKVHVYMKRRAPRKVSFAFPDPESEPIPVNINAHLFVWVVENLLRNSLDAMGRSGEISAHVYEDEKFVYVDLSDTGHGIPASKIKTVFQPGYSTKKRGWGLGLSLAKRIIEDYHLGKIFVKKSVVDEGTTFTIQLPK
ncbi:MAG: HAMP domain-containing sensor histidine kinase [Bacteroidota bacterium]